MEKNIGNRPDGRNNMEMRQIKFTPGYVDYPEGSVLIEVGKTRVLCNASIENKVPGWIKDGEHGWLTAEYAMLPRATQTRTPREIKGLKGRTQEIKRLIGRSLRQAVDLKLLGEYTLMLDCDVLQADGGTRTASITGGYLAAALALNKLIKEGLIPPETLNPPIAAISMGVVNGNTCLDLCYQEDFLADVDFNVVMNASGEFIEIQGTAEGKTFDRHQLNDMLALAEKGISELIALQEIFLSTV
ncbi:MAG: ribonuclease PH [Anaerolineaceae bacterium]|nr:ribonuclease PH [Anaerolineaceae bacterium]